MREFTSTNDSDALRGDGISELTKPISVASIHDDVDDEVVDDEEASDNDAVEDNIPAQTLPSEETVLRNAFNGEKATLNYPTVGREPLNDVFTVNGISSDVSFSTRRSIWRE